MNNKEGELKKQIQENAEDWEDTPWQTLKEELNEGVADVNTQISLDKLFEILDEAMQDLIASVHDSCWFHNEAGCDAPDWKVYHNQPEDCPLRKIEKWFGGVDESE